MVRKILCLLISICMIPAQGIGIFAADFEGNGITDIIYFGDADSESAHDFEEFLSVAGVDDSEQPEQLDENKMLTGGGLGHGLTYRYITPNPDKKPFAGKLEFTLKVEAYTQNYLTVRLSGSQSNRGHLLLFGPDGDRTILNPRAGKDFAELDSSHDKGAPFVGRYYYSTYIIPQGLIDKDGFVRLSIMSTGNFGTYGTNQYMPQTENSKYIYSAATHTNPFYTPDDTFTGQSPKGVPAAGGQSSSYEVLQAQAVEFLELVMSWQLFGLEFDKYKNQDNEFLEGAVVTYQTVDSHAEFSATKDEWAKRVTAKAINHQNWSPMMAAEIFANALMYDWSGKYHQNPEMLERIIKAYDFFVKAQDSNGAWCVPEKGENAWSWIGADLNGSGARGKGENWPLMALGTDSMTQTFINLDNYISNTDNQQLRLLYNQLMDEKIDSDLTANKTLTRRQAYIEMFGRLRNYLSKPVWGDFYDPKARAGTANQDFGFAYDVNLLIKMLSDGAEGLDIPAEFAYKDDTEFIEQVKYKFSQMVDGEKWFSDNGLGLEGGVSHGGWAGDYGTLLLKIINKYAETFKDDENLKDFYNKLSYDAHEAAKYFFRPGVTADGVNVLLSENTASSRNNGYGQRIVYPISPYSALELKSEGALRFLTKYIEDNRAFGETFRKELEEKTPHIYTRTIEIENLVKYYQQLQQLEQTAEYLPMEQEHPDFTWYDCDSQTVVFKNNGDKAYVVFNYRRDKWSYNDNARIHFTTDNTDRIANVVSTHQGGIYTFEDSSRPSTGKSFTHNRFDGLNQVRYGKYVIAINLSKEDLAVGQTGKVFTLDTRGIKKAKDLVNGTIYDYSTNGDITVTLAPRQAAVLEIMEEAPVFNVYVRSLQANKILSIDTIPHEIGQPINVDAKAKDGYKLEDLETKSLVPTADNNIIDFNYSQNSLPVFGPTGLERHAEFTTIDVGRCAGTVRFDEFGQPIEITSIGDTSDRLFSKTFVYKEISGKTEIKARLDRFENTASDNDYFSLIISDNVNLQQGNYVELRHFPNNNNILLVSHVEGADTVTSYWGGDMNNKSVPIYFRLLRDGNTFRYYFSLDQEKSYEETSKPVIEFSMANKMYVGAAMTCSTGISNTAYISDLTISGDTAVQPIELGKEISVSLKAHDPDGDEVRYEFDWLPPEAVVGQDNVLTWTPAELGNYQLSARAYDRYHAQPTEKTLQFIVYSDDMPSIIINDNVLTGSIIKRHDRIFFPVYEIAEALGGVVALSHNGVDIVKEDVTVGFIENDNCMYKNDIAVEMDVEPILIDSTMYVPVRYLAEALGFSVAYVAGTVILTT